MLPQKINNCVARKFLERRLIRISHPAANLR
jgi:hypothetical protein